MRRAIVALALILAAVPTAGGLSEPAGRAVELWFEVKLFLRGRGPLGAVVDQWAGGRLLMRRSSVEGGSRFELVRPLDDPWVFRWYDAKDEVKLGAAVSVAQPAGDPYGALAPALTRRARELYDRWWDSDEVEPLSGARPSWASATERFWAERHTRESKRKDPLHADPVYPFHVLGDPAGRFVFEVAADGGVRRESIAERMSVPWLRNGWSDWLAGRGRVGYGYWAATGRPDWEPGTYPAFARAVALLSWPALDADRARAEPSADGYHVDVDGSDASLPAAAAAVVEALSPETRAGFQWTGSTPLFFVVRQAAGGTVEVTGESGPLDVDGKPAVRYRVWRHAALGPDGLERDEVQLLVEDPRHHALKLWIRVGYRSH